MATRRSFLSGSVSLISLASLGISGLRPFVAYAQSVAFDYYISPDGSDTNTGSRESPWAITALQTKTQHIAARRVGLLPGTYNVGNLMPNDWTSAAVTVTASGSATSPTIIESVEPQGAILTTVNGINSTANSGVIKIGPGTQYVQIRGIRFSNLYHHAIRVNGSNIVIESCWFHDIGRDVNGDNLGAICTGLSAFGRNLLVRNCLFERIRNSTLTVPGDFSTGVGDNSAAIGPIYDYTDITVEWCTFRDVAAAMFLKRNCGNYTYRYNFSWRTKYALLSFHRSDVEKLDDNGKPYAYDIYKNIANNNIFALCRLISQDGNQSGQWLVDMDFFNNTIIFVGSRAGDGGLWSVANDASNTDPVPSRPHQWAWYNNAFFQLPGSNVGEWAKVRAGAVNWPARARVWDFNAYNVFGYTDDVTARRWTSLSAWQTEIGLDRNSKVVSDLGFSNVQGDAPKDFTLVSTSPLRNAGRAGGVTSGSPTDIGAWGGGANQVGCSLGVRPLPPSVAVS